MGTPLLYCMFCQTIVKQTTEKHVWNVSDEPLRVYHFFWSSSLQFPVNDPAASHPRQVSDPLNSCCLTGDDSEELVVYILVRLLSEPRRVPHNSSLQLSSSACKGCTVILLIAFPPVGYMTFRMISSSGKQIRLLKNGLYESLEMVVQW